MTTIKTVSVSETRQQLSAFLNSVREKRQDVVIQNRGQAEAVIIPYADYALLQEARERRRRQAALDELQQIAQEVQARNASITAVAADELADEIVREAIENLSL